MIKEEGNFNVKVIVLINKSKDSFLSFSGFPYVCLFKKILIMKVNTIFLTCILVLVVSLLGASEVDISKARTLAKNFYFAKTNQFDQTIKFDDITIAGEQTKHLENVPVYYIFTFDKTGYVIVSAEDVLPAVLGYSFNSYYSEFEAPDAYRNFMQSYSDAILFVRHNKIPQSDEIKNLWELYMNNDPEALMQNGKEKSVDPLLLCKWDQGYPYNVLCPEDQNGPGGYVYSGCVATAMAQVMYYWRYPLQGTGSHSYYYYPYGNLSANFGATNYRWTGMINSIDHSYPEPNAELQYHCGVAVEMMYGPNGSGAYSWDVPYALENYFGYDNDCYYASKDDYNNTTWKNMLKDNIDQGWPMYYSGYSSAGGHAFVCDGYQDDYFHFNFGWGGSSDGFYTLLSVNGFNQGQGAIFDTYPESGYPYFWEDDFVLADISGSFTDGSGPVEDYANNTNCTWLIDPQTEEDSISSITLKFFAFETEVNDYVTVYDGESAQDNLLGEFSGDNIPESITSSGNKMYIVFNSDDSGAGAGFYAEYEANKPEFCSMMQVYIDPSGTISDGSGNFNYQNSTTCMWKIEPEMAESVTLSFTSFDTENEFDKVLIYDTETQDLLAEYSGSYSSSNLPDPVTSPSGKMFVAFSSGPSITGSGWEAEYTSILTGVETTTNVENEVLIYPNPASELLNIELHTEVNDKMLVEILSLDGQAQFHQNFEIGGKGQKLTVSIADLATGVYVLKLNSTTYSVCRRIIKN